MCAVRFYFNKLWKKAEWSFNRCSSAEFPFTNEIDICLFFTLLSVLRSAMPSENVLIHLGHFFNLTLKQGMLELLGNMFFLDVSLQF